MGKVNYMHRDRENDDDGPPSWRTWQNLTPDINAAFSFKHFCFFGTVLCKTLVMVVIRGQSQPIWHEHHQITTQEVTYVSFHSHSD